MKKEFSFLLGEVQTAIKMSTTARFDCKENGFSEIVVTETPTFATDYILGKTEGDRFTIVDADLNMVVTGIVTYRGETELELLITNVNGDVEVVKSNRSIEDYMEF